MSASTEPPREPTDEAVISQAFGDFLVPGVVVALEAAEAEALGAFAETALTEEEAWEANADLDEAGDVA